ncbi:MAG: 3-deoxy-7-phosphoheptulonate synthase [Melioribacteraceae bacterium]|nr:3-deoxy-7-phosphoheptulonate synthase [Melioribacteraceae bacterium]MCF8354198.1 3-deoxy-7-phosphoheptulonate synthase [Melioribacteraceae bacterium]MCF8392844.1 3-deoxy-7-phosphoheptulonate synthase [Melioribacteraceae bacterium]MCF8418670.1 3-deoxy-7-phosphoheptulonate synthase [Melioribacteraceae bacterium]
MLIIMGLDSPDKDVENVKDKVKSNGCVPHVIPGASKLAIGITGPTNKLNDEDFQLMPSVQEVVRVTKKYKLVSRQMKNEDTVIDFGSAKVGNKELMIIAGPCSVESRDQIFDIAGQLKEMGIKFLRAGAYKPRSSPYSFQGLKEKGIEYLLEVKKELGMKIVTEVLNPGTLGIVSEAADIIQIGARNMQNFTLIEEAGKTGKPILLKRGMSATVEDLLLSAEYILSQNNYNVILCERGIRTFETSTRNTLDLNAIPVIKQNSHLPIIVDPSHGIGIGDKVPNMALAAVASGADGLMIEVHHKPESALSDGYQSLTPKKFKELLNKLSELAPIVNKELKL